jgi:RNase P subunit RPR2
MGDITVWIILGIVVFVLAAGAFFVMRLRKSGADAVYHFRCPGCKRRLRYHARQVGHRGMCSHCREPLTFPAVSRAAR